MIARRNTSGDRLLQQMDRGRRIDGSTVGASLHDAVLQLRLLAQ
jgi:hypothetical protein